MLDAMRKCPECGGGPIRPLTWRRTGRDGMQRVKCRCRNCGTVTEPDPDRVRA